MKDKGLLESVLSKVGSSDILRALNYIALNKWDEAHNIAQTREGEQDYDKIHAFLHRIEGDEWNAKYWYRKINEPFPKISLDEEWNKLAKQYLINNTK